VVEVDIGDDRDRRLFDDRLQGDGVLLAGHGYPDQVGSSLRAAVDLRQRLLEVRRLGLGHRLDGDRRAPAHQDTANAYLAL
jgi:hypothetical protein